MSPKRVLALPGDRRETAEAAALAVEAAAPGVDIIWGDMDGGGGRAVTPETANLILASDAVLCGPVRDAPGGRGVAASLCRHLRLYAHVGEYWPLCSYIGSKSTDLVVVSMTPVVATSVTEIDSLDGVSSEVFISEAAAAQTFARAIAIAEAKRRRGVAMVLEGETAPGARRMIGDSFRRHFAASEFEAEVLEAAEFSSRLAVDPSSLDVVVAGPVESPFVRGQAAGMVGGCGLMPNGYVGNGPGLFLPEPSFGPEGREGNPTSAILSAAMMLLHLGMADAYSSIKRAVREMYRLGRTTPDIGGNTPPGEFAEGVAELVRANR